MTSKSSGPGTVYKTYTESISCGGSNTYTTYDYMQRKSHIGADTPHFHKLKREGALIPVNPFVQDEVSGTFSGGWSLTRSGDGCTWSAGEFLPLSYGLQVLPTEAQIGSWLALVNQDLLLQQAYAGLQADFDALTFLVELRQLPEMIFGALRRLLDLLSSPTSRKLANGYLEVRYGWRPLLSDLKAINDVIQDIAKSKPEFVRRRSSASFGITETTSANLNYGSWAGAWELTFVVGISSRASVISKIQPPRVQADPLLTFWEVIPYSFVLDWFVSIGTALSALSAFRTHVDAIAGVGSYITVDTTGRIVNGRGIGSFTGTVSSSSFTQMTRTIRGPGHVSFTPQFRCNLSAAKILDLVAMARQRFR